MNEIIDKRNKTMRQKTLKKIQRTLEIDKVTNRSVNQETDIQRSFVLITSLRERVKTLEIEKETLIERANRLEWMINNPPIFKVGDMVNIPSKPSPCMVVGVDRGAWTKKSSFTDQSGYYNAVTIDVDGVKFSKDERSLTKSK